LIDSIDGCAVASLFICLSSTQLTHTLSLSLTHHTGTMIQHDPTTVHNNNNIISLFDTRLSKKRLIYLGMVLLILILLMLQALFNSTRSTLRDSTQRRQRLQPLESSASVPSIHDAEEVTTPFGHVSRIGLAEAQLLLEVRSAIKLVASSMDSFDIATDTWAVLRGLPSTHERDGCFHLADSLWLDGIEHRRSMAASFDAMIPILEHNKVHAWLDDESLVSSLRSGFAVYDTAIALNFVVLDGEDSWYSLRASLRETLGSLGGFHCKGTSVTNQWRHTLSCRLRGHDSARIELRAMFPISNDTFFNSVVGRVPIDLMMPPRSCIFFNHRFRCPARSLEYLLLRTRASRKHQYSCLLNPSWRTSLDESIDTLMTIANTTTTDFASLSPEAQRLERWFMQEYDFVESTLQLEKCGFPSMAPLVPSFRLSNYTTCDSRIPMK